MCVPGFFYEHDLTEAEGMEGPGAEHGGLWLKAGLNGHVEVQDVVDPGLVGRVHPGMVLYEIRAMHLNPPVQKVQRHTPTLSHL